MFNKKFVLLYYHTYIQKSKEIFIYKGEMKSVKNKDDKRIRKII